MKKTKKQQQKNKTKKQMLEKHTQILFTCSKSIIKTPEQYKKSAQN